MQRLMIVTVAGGILLAASMGALGESSEQPSFEERLEAWLPGMGAEAIPDRQQSQQALQQALFELGAPGREAELTAACKLVAGKLGPETAKPARIWMLRQLEFSGGAECVDAVAACLWDQDAEVRECARRALQNNPAPAANAKLLADLEWVVDDVKRVAIINALGYRGDRSSVPALSKLLDGPNEAIGAAAANALGKIGGPEACGALRSAGKKVSGALKVRVADALLRCADKLLQEGERSEAAAIYQEMASPKAPRAIRLAGLKGKLNAAGDDAAAMVLKMLDSDDADQQAIAAAHVADLGGSAVARLAERSAQLSAPAKRLLLAALAAKGDKAAMPVALAAANSENDELRVSGLRALAKLGDAKAVPLLVEALAAGGEASEAARESLRQVFGDGADEAIIAAMQKAEVGLRRTLIDVLDDRGNVKAADALLEEAEHEDAGIRGQAVEALGNLAEPRHVAAMIAVLLKTEKGRPRDDVEKAVMLVCSRIGDAEKRADPVLAVISRSSDEDRCVLLPLLGRIGGAKAGLEVADAIGSDNPQVQEAGVRALCNWPDAGFADELLDIVQSRENETYARWALRAYVRVITLPSDRGHEKTLAMLKKAMELADRDDEKRLIVDRADSARHVETLRWLVPMLDDPAVSPQACRSIVELAHYRELMGPNQEEFRKALEKVISITKEPGLIDRAKRYMSGL